MRTPLLRAAGVIAVTGCLTLALLWNALFADMPRLPDTDELWDQSRQPSIAFIDATGEVIAVRGPDYGRVVRLKELPSHVIDAFISIEDRKFREHEGVDFLAIVRAMLENLRAGHTVQGASTITQQLAKNLFLTTDQTLMRKAQEARLALELENRLSKEEILELYLNRIYLGAGAYGVEAASRIYFGTDIREVSLAQAAMLASFPKAPSRFSSAAASPRVRARQLYVLSQMREAGFISRAEEEEAAAEELTLAPEQRDAFSGHALDYAADQVRLLVPNPPPDLVVTLTLDLSLQTATQEALEAGLARAVGAKEGAVLLADTDGAIRAMVGGRDYQASKFNRAVQARRQPGSAFKMFVYAAALEAGLQPGTIRYDEPVRIGSWRPRNYDGGYRGPVTLSEALALSLNTVAAQLGVEIGIDKVAALARRFGVKSELGDYPSLALGSDETTLLDLVTGYGVLARGGLEVSPYMVTEVRNTRGERLYRRSTSSAQRLYPPDLTEDMNAMLSRVVLRGTGRAAQVPGWQIAGKTGTSQDWRDAWFLGYSTRYVCGVWLGNDDDASMGRMTGGEGPARIFASAMTRAHQGLTPEPLPGASRPEDFLDPDQQARLAFFRSLSAAFASVQPPR